MSAARKKCLNCGAKTRTLDLKECKKCHQPFPIYGPNTEQKENTSTADAATDPKGGKKMNTVLKILLGAFLVVCLVIALMFLFGGFNKDTNDALNNKLAVTQTPAVTTASTVPSASVSVLPEASASASPSTSAVTTTDIGYIKYSLNGKKTWESAPELTGDYGHRIAFTCAQALFPNASWDYKFSSSDWKTIENTWIDVQVSVPAGTISRVWCYSWKQNNKTYDGGYLMELPEGQYEFSIKNGEDQNWSPTDSYFTTDLGRIFQQKRDGNVNVEHELAFTGITANLKDRIPSDLKYSEITIGPTATTTTK